MNRETAFAIVEEYISNENLIRHMLAVEAAMRFYAEKLEQDQELWGMTGLLHDFDWEIHPTLDEHPMAGETYPEGSRCTGCDHTGDTQPCRAYRGAPDDRDAKRVCLPATRSPD